MEIDKVIEFIYRKDYSALQKLASEGEVFDGADPEGRTPLMHAILASDADVKMVEFLIKYGADPNHIDKAQGWTALHFAARDQNLDIVSLLLEKKARIDPQDCFGNTPLWRCIMSSKVDVAVVQLLLVYGADAGMKNLSGTSPKDIAERLGKTDVLSILP